MVLCNVFSLAFVSYLVVRFAKICYMFERKGKKYFHGQWYQHGAYTILQESAHPQSLFLIEECEDQLLECIYQKCNLHTLSVSEDEKIHTESGDYNLFSGFALLALVFPGLITCF